MCELAIGLSSIPSINGCRIQTKIDSTLISHHPPKDAELTDVIFSLLEALNADSDEHLHQNKSCAVFIDAFIIFDEACTLADSYHEDKDKESHFAVHCQIVSVLSTVPLFSFSFSHWESHTVQLITWSGQIFLYHCW